MHQVQEVQGFIDHTVGAHHHQFAHTEISQSVQEIQEYHHPVASSCSVFHTHQFHTTISRQSEVTKLLVQQHTAHHQPHHQNEPQPPHHTTSKLTFLTCSMKRRVQLLVNICTHFQLHS